MLSVGEESVRLSTICQLGSIGRLNHGKSAFREGKEGIPFKSDSDLPLRTIYIADVSALIELRNLGPWTGAATMSQYSNFNLFGSLQYYTLNIF